MPFRKFKTTIKKKKYPYWMICGTEHIIGSTDDVHRTLTSIWKVYRDCEKCVCINLGTANKVKELCITENNTVIEYKYRNKMITKQEFKELI